MLEDISRVAGEVLRALTGLIGVGAFNLLALRCGVIGSRSFTGLFGVTGGVSSSAGIFGVAAQELERFISSACPDFL